MASKWSPTLGPNGPTYLLKDWPMNVDFLFLFCIYVGWIVVFVYLNACWLHVVYFFTIRSSHQGNFQKKEYFFIFFVFLSRELRKLCERISRDAMKGHAWVIGITSKFVNRLYGL